MDFARITGMQPGSSYVWIGEEEDIARLLDAGGKLGTDEASVSRSRTDRRDRVARV